MENKETQSSRVVFYLTKTNKELLINHCQLLNVKPTFFIRNLVLEKLGKPTFQPAKIDLNTNEYIKELASQGANLNQIARKLNSGNQFLIADQQDVLNQIELISKQILEIKSQLK